MRIRRLDLRAFGPFTNVELDFGAEPGRLHVVYGPNEAGKSSSLRALRQFFFGIDQRTEDAFLHKYSDLRVGAVLESANGERLECVRRKGQRDTVRGADDNAVLDAALLGRMLGGLGRDLYEQMFGLNHQSLVAGGRELAQGRGELGQLLFAAGAGMTDLRRVQQELANEAAFIFKSGNATNPQINQSLRDLLEARRELKSAQLPSAEWAKQDEAYRTTAEQKRKLDGRRAACHQERERLALLSRARPLVAARQRLRDELAALGELPVLAEDFADRRREVLASLEASTSAALVAERALADLDRRLAESEAPAGLLAEAQQIEELQRQLGSVVKAAFDQVGLRSLADQAQATAEKLLRDLRPGLALADVESLRLNRRQRNRIQSLLLAQAGLTARDEQAREQCARLSATLVLAKESLAQLPQAVDTTELRRTGARIERQGALEEQAAELAAKITRLERQANTELAKLFSWSGDLDAVEQLVPPPAETIDAWESQLRDASQRVTRVDEQWAAARTAVDQTRLQIDEMRALREPPSEAQMLAARQARDEVWRAVRDRLRGQPDAAREAELIATHAAADLAAAFESQAQRADELSDELRREADRAGEFARLLVREREQSRLLAQRETDLAAAREAVGQVESQWHAIWAPLGIEPRRPGEMRAWLAQHGRIVDLVAQLRDEQRRAAALAERVQEACKTLVAALASSGVTIADDKLSLLLERASEVCTSVEQCAAERKSQTVEIARLQRELPGAEQAVRDSTARLNDWRRDWSEAIRPLGLAADASAEEATALLSGIVDLFEQLDAAARDRERVAGIDRERAAFEEHVAEVARRLAPDLVRQPAQQAASVLSARLTAARQAEERRAALQAERRREEKKLRDAQSAIAAGQQTLSALCRQASCESPDELSEIEARVAQRSSLMVKLHDREEQLLEAAAGRNLEDLAAEVARESDTDVTARLTELDEEIRVIDDQRDGLAQSLGALEAAIKLMDGGPRAAQAANRAEAVRAALVGQVEQYARTRLAAAVLREAIDRYRQRHQDPVLSRASELFAELTLGSFTGLRTEIADDGQPLLVGVRAGNAAHVGVEGMSEGTCDQLYLALRLASLEQCLATREPVPLVIDDLLINFDNARAAATLEVLARLASRTQVILFTHHLHLLELAGETLEPGAWREHRLPLREVPSPVVDQAAAAAV
jgi:uncharacterized protein YhaN